MLKILFLTLVSLNAFSQSQDPVFMNLDDAELTAPTPVTNENLGQNLADALAQYEESVINTDELPLYVVMDITRGVETAIAYQYGKEVRRYTVHGGMNKTAVSDKNETSCAFTTAGRFQPTALEKLHVSKESAGAEMRNYVELDSARGLGAHTGNVGKGQYSHACIRQKAADSKWLFDEVKKVSIMKGQRVYQTGAVIDVIDNTPGVAEAKQECLKKCRAGKRYCSTPWLFDGDMPIRPLTTKKFGNMLPSLLEKHLQFRPPSKATLDSEKPIKKK